MINNIPTSLEKFSRKPRTVFIGSIENKTDLVNFNISWNGRKGSFWVRNILL